MSDRVRITDVAPRDGLQNEPRPISAGHKIELVRRLARAGVDEVEVSSFVSPRWIPQLGDAAEVFAGLAGQKPTAVLFSALVPNETGLKAALAVNQNAGERLIDKVSVFTSASETFARNNTNASIAETLRRFEPVLAGARAAGLATRGYVSCVVRCPFEGPIAPRAVCEVALKLLELGVEEIDLGDTIGAADPDSIRALLTEVRAELPPAAWRRLTLHVHDTFGQAGACVATALEMGVRLFDGAAGGLGGCPYASTPGRRAPGNIDTQALVAVCRAHGYSVGVDDERLAEAGAFARTLVGLPAR